jgi:hypothetical protein
LIKGIGYACILILRKKRRQTMSNIFKTFQELLDFIELHDVTDETNYDSGGQPYKTRTKHFGHLIDKAREELGKLAQLPYPSMETDENGISYITRIRLDADAKLRKELLDAD